jgi:hypothetical protein
MNKKTHKASDATRQATADRCHPAWSNMNATNKVAKIANIMGLASSG